MAENESPQAGDVTEAEGSSFVSGSRVIAAPAQLLFDIVADPSMHHVIDGSGTVRHVRGNPGRLSLGASFTTNMNMVLPYIMRNTVKEFDDGKVIAWAHIGGWRWRYEFEDVSSSDAEPLTRVTETFDWGPSKAGAYINFMKWPAKNKKNIQKTLARLDKYVTDTRASL